MKRSKRYEGAVAQIEEKTYYDLDDAITKLKAVASARFDETAEITLNLGIKPQQHVVRGTCSLPHGTGKSVRVLVFAKGANVTEAEEAGADFVGGDDLAKKIQDGWLEFDKVVATPDMMPVVGKLGKVLGPRGLMPSPKTGTVTKDVGKMVEELKKGMVEFRADRYGVVHSVFGKCSFEPEMLKENLITMLKSVYEARPEEGLKGRYMKKICVSSTMGPGILLDLGEVSAITEPG